MNFCNWYMVIGIVVFMLLVVSIGFNSKKYDALTVLLSIVISVFISAIWITYIPIYALYKLGQRIGK